MLRLSKHLEYNNHLIFKDIYLSDIKSMKYSVNIDCQRVDDRTNKNR